VYGPVPSRRLGQSLGVDPIPFKTCNYNCVYCQLGRTRPLVCERGEYGKVEEILAQVSDAVSVRAAGEIDHVTLVGQGEPTLHTGLADIIRGIKELTAIPIAVVTNGSLLCRPEVREELALSGVVLPSLDAATQRGFRRINRPCPRMRIEEIVEGMAAFCQSFAGQVWVEVMLVRGLNDDASCLSGLHDALEQIRPDRVQVNVPVRPPAEPWVKVPGDETVAHAQALLGETVEVVAPYAGTFGLDGQGGIVEAVLAVIRRHPMREVRLLDTLMHFSPGRVRGTLTDLEATGQARRREYRGEAFWESAQICSGAEKE
jgi:wyosine [tRNA(Phe)-imidazoG37] synthetase (radical SAM superfamily)